MELHAVKLSAVASDWRERLALPPLDWAGLSSLQQQTFKAPLYLRVCPQFHACSQLRSTIIKVELAEVRQHTGKVDKFFWCAFLRAPHFWTGFSVALFCSSHREGLGRHDLRHEKALVTRPRHLVPLLQQLDHRRVVKHSEVLQEESVAIKIHARLGEKKIANCSKKKNVAYDELRHNLVLGIKRENGHNICKPRRPIGRQQKCERTSGQR